MLAPPLLYNLSAVDDVVLRVTPIINIDGSINPNGKFVDEVALLWFERVICTQVYDVVWVKSREDLILLIHQYLGQDENTILQLRVIVITYITHTHCTLYTF